jgi:WD40 repeat protein
VTAAEDGTLRIWDTETATQRTVVKPTVDRPGRVAVTACAYGDDGALLAAGLSSGVLQLWDVKGKRQEWPRQTAVLCPVKA